ncbi:NUDIX hydrolase [Marivita sp. S6314]|uniref:NUDIX domain-containing protein n=1 Tax=Marivita sp. S6314 TaxID=2926406 RepID=UPI001FF3BAD5|nr:NUDIX hydrolase [Marivita sp. S6314]MCK0151764.1 NUDIX hydrolase [Marivita sp. S6314]
MALADFGGAKLILFIGPRIVVIERDHADGIPWPGYLDLPGGGREQDESAEACVLREAQEEIGLQLDPRDLVWCAQLNRGVFFAAHLKAHREMDIVFGSEGIGWALMTPQDYATHPKAIPHFARMVRTYLATRA